MSIIFLVLGGGGILGFLGGSADYIFMGARIFLRKKRPKLFNEFLGRLQRILCYWKNFSVPKLYTLLET